MPLARVACECWANAKKYVSPRSLPFLPSHILQCLVYFSVPLILPGCWLYVNWVCSSTPTMFSYITSLFSSPCSRHIVDCWLHGNLSLNVRLWRFLPFPHLLFTRAGANRTMVREWARKGLGAVGWVGMDLLGIPAYVSVYGSDG